jgi:nucleoside-diphosphate-sugar epimerase
MAGREVFLTGATGFIGGGLARALIARGDRLRCLVRDSTRALWLERLGATLVQGDITDDVALERGMRGADLVYHVAGAYDIGALIDRADLERVNVDGTAAVLRVARHVGGPPVVYASTTGAFRPTQPGREHEIELLRPPFPTVYQRTKARAHELAVEAAARGLPVTIGCPAVVYGPGDTSSNARFMRSILRRTMPGLLTTDAWFSYVHVDDVVRGFVAAGERGTPGAVYLFSGHDESLSGFARRVADLAGTGLNPVRFPPALARATCAVLDPVARRLRLRLVLNGENVAFVSGHRWLHHDDRARDELGYTWRPLEAGLPGTVAWLRDGGRPSDAAADG